MATLNSISVQELAEIGDKSTVELIDVRTPAEYRETHSTIARNVPLDELDAEKLLADRNSSADQPLYVICNSGNRSRKACEKLINAGCTNVVNVQGGTQAWEQADLPVVRGKKTVSLERQVRIAAGSLVLLGSVLALTVHPYFAGLAAFVGAGLVFAGVTDTCGMAMLLAKMPWNRVSSEDQQCHVA
ncbi:Inner membrane protein YgaP [Symmachiella macrocystis]|uniref:Inner membrane protein YgaP n=1 Tax=Symmachiella macrocystis TaxID=2527985 RepID=A0A5C6BN55_9PLAN|nr:rhodanese-like domain-containing protein [Symmachiella macrocystis]TWU13455.1 Inner membrane protein YgaP [Symmachiella macrocystis]